MAKLLCLSTEMFLQVLLSLIQIDLRAALVSQRVCRAFRYGILDILQAARDTGDFKIHPLWIEKFGHLFYARYALSKASSLSRRIGRGYVKDALEPFRNLSWARTRESREPYLRPCATWRSLSLTFGGPPITCIDVLHNWCFDDGSGAIERFIQAEPACVTTGLTMGTFYDFLAAGSKTTGINKATISWELLLGYRLAITMDELRTLDPTRPTDMHTRAFFSQGVEGHAVLFVNSRYRGEELGSSGHVSKSWIPRPIGPAAMRIFPWHGCLNDLDVDSWPLLSDSLIEE
ncbi:hypothetical protein F4803DRAFT_544822 [Xylaria telfairii]|nr:hypothetical protein F4803DRAFT_544822 [Xylaria telfairii]